MKLEIIINPETKVQLSIFPKLIAYRIQLPHKSYVEQSLCVDKSEMIDLVITTSNKAIKKSTCTVENRDLRQMRDLCIELINKTSFEYAKPHKTNTVGNHARAVC